MQKKNYYFMRTLRTLTSERYDIFSFESEGSIGMADIHYKTNDECYMTLFMYQSISSESIDILIKEIDDDIVDMADIEKGNFFVRCYTGKELAGFSVDKEWKRPVF